MRTRTPIVTEPVPGVELRGMQTIWRFRLFGGEVRFEYSRPTTIVDSRTAQAHRVADFGALLRAAAILAGLMLILHNRGGTHVRA